MTLPHERFAHLVASADPPLDVGAALIAALAPRPDAPDPDATVASLDDLARGCPEATLDGLRAYLFEELGFRGNNDDYGDPANSYLDAVIERRRGIPISLSVVLIEVGRRAGVHLGGVGMPGHFLVKSLHEPEVFIDAFGGGRFLGLPECHDLFRRLHGDAAFESSFLEVVPSSAILWRMLSNLREGFAGRGDLNNLRWVVEAQLDFPDVGVADRRHLGALLGMTGAVRRAADELEAVADALPDGDAEAARRQARVLRARLN